MNRRVLLGAFAPALALALFARSPALADAAKPSTPFAGTYEGRVPGAGSILSIEIGRSGQVSGSGSFVWYFGYDTDGNPIVYKEYADVKGAVTSGGEMSLDVTLRNEPHGGQHTITSQYTLSASVSLDAGGNIVGVTSAGDTIQWRRT